MTRLRQSQFRLGVVPDRRVKSTPAGYHEAQLSGPAGNDTPLNARPLGLTHLLDAWN